jgi:hypothetical protein
MVTDFLTELKAFGMDVDLLGCNAVQLETDVSEKTY